MAPQFKNSRILPYFRANPILARRRGGIRKKWRGRSYRRNERVRLARGRRASARLPSRGARHAAGAQETTRRHLTPPVRVRWTCGGARTRDPSLRGYAAPARRTSFVSDLPCGRRLCCSVSALQGQHYMHTLRSISAGSGRC